MRRNSTTVALHRLGISLLLPHEWRGNAKLVYVFREDYDEELLWFHEAVAPGNVVIDIGANIGAYSAVASKKVGSEGLVFAFEPAGSTFSVLESNLHLNYATNVRAYRLGLSDHSGKAKLFMHDDSSRHSLAETARSQYETVAVTTLDKVMSDHCIDNVDFIKLDVEGAEQLVLAGSIGIIEEHWPMILFEINNPATESLGLDRLGAWRMLEEMGYVFFALRNDGEVAVLEDPPERLTNIIAKPPAGPRQSDSPIAQRS
jgi:FkbM family methyltransferase